MFQQVTFICPRVLAGKDFAIFQLYLTLFILSAICGLRCYGADQSVSPSEKHVAAAHDRHFVTSVAQFYNLTGEDYLDGCDFRLTGVVTLVDPGRDLVVLQDSTGAVALNFRMQNLSLCFGQRISIDGTNCCPCFDRFPEYPYRPTKQEVRGSFEAPSGCGDYYLTRMRGYLRPPTTGEYSFWIASDNSSELWLSTDDNPSGVRKIAFVPRFEWVLPRDWSHYPSQRSENIWLQSDKTYYIEAYQEQTTVGDNLAVAWQGPGLNQSVIDGRYLTPYGSQPTNTATTGILREFWTNYISGDLSDIGGARPFKSALSVENVGIKVLGRGELPKPEPIGPNWNADNNYRWVTAQGIVKFTGAEENAARFQLEGNQMEQEVRSPYLTPSFLQKMRSTPVRVDGVCEGVFDEAGKLVPGIIWISNTNNIHLLESAETNINPAASGAANSSAVVKTNVAMQGFYSTHGIVTFNDSVLGQDYLVVQEDEESAILVSGGESAFYQKQLKVGEWVELGGALQPGKYLPIMAPLVITKLGWHSMPVPVTDQMNVSAPADVAGKWSELEGVVHSVNSNGTLSAITREGPVNFWIGRTSTNELAHYVDATLRTRGVYFPNAFKTPMLLIPSGNYVDIEEPAPEKPFEVRNHSIAELGTEATGNSSERRVKVTGEITYRDAYSFFLQDASGGIRILDSTSLNWTNREVVEVLGFPTMNGSIRTLTDTLVRTANVAPQITPNNLDLSEAFSSRQHATLVVTKASVLAQKTDGNIQVLELQENQRVFAASLAIDRGHLPEIAPGSRVQIIGVCNNDTTGPLLPDEKPPAPQTLASLEILMRTPTDLTVLSGPPWWTLKRTVTLVGALMITIAVTLLWIHLLGRRLERQQAAQLEFSRKILERLEDERRRIAVNLHDSLGQILLAIKYQAHLAIQPPSESQELQQRLEDISSTTSQALEEIRHITHGLRPYQLDRLGLTQAIRASVGRIPANPISFAVRVEDIDGLFNRDAEIHVYRIVQEAVTNVVKHSAASEAAVVIKKRAMAVSLSIRDNGLGFDASKPVNHSQSMGFGLSGIAERVRILGGTFNIDSQKGQGTSLTIEIPLVNYKNETTDISAHR